MRERVGDQGVQWAMLVRIAALAFAMLAVAAVAFAARADALTPPPPPSIEDIIAEVNGAELPHGIENSLLAKLEGALRKRDAGQLDGACGSLGAYINEVRAQNGKKLETEYAEDLLTLATAVRDALGCGTT